MSNLACELDSRTQTSLNGTVIKVRNRRSVGLFSIASEYLAITKISGGEFYQLQIQKADPSLGRLSILFRDLSRRGLPQVFSSKADPLIVHFAIHVDKACSS